MVCTLSSWKFYERYVKLMLYFINKYNTSWIHFKNKNKLYIFFWQTTYTGEGCQPCFIWYQRTKKVEGDRTNTSNTWPNQNKDPCISNLTSALHFLSKSAWDIKNCWRSFPKEASESAAVFTSLNTWTAQVDSYCRRLWIRWRTKHKG